MTETTTIEGAIERLCGKGALFVQLRDGDSVGAQKRAVQNGSFEARLKAGGKPQAEEVLQWLAEHPLGVGLVPHSLGLACLDNDGDGDNRFDDSMLGLFNGDGVLAETRSVSGKSHIYAVAPEGCRLGNRKWSYGGCQGEIRVGRGYLVECADGLVRLADALDSGAPPVVGGDLLSVLQGRDPGVVVSTGGPAALSGDLAVDYEAALKKNGGNRNDALYAVVREAANAAGVRGEAAPEESDFSALAALVVGGVKGDDEFTAVEFSSTVRSAIDGGHGAGARHREKNAPQGDSGGNGGDFDLAVYESIGDPVNKLNYAFGALFEFARRRGTLERLRPDERTAYYRLKGACEGIGWTAFESAKQVYPHFIGAMNDAGVRDVTKNGFKPFMIDPKYFAAMFAMKERELLSDFENLPVAVTHAEVYIEECAAKWKGVKALDGLMDRFFDTSDWDSGERLHYEGALKRHFVAAVRRTRHPGAVYENVVCFVGAAYSGKTRFWSSMVPDDRKYLIAENARLNVDGRDVIRKTDGRMFAVFDELGGLAWRDARNFNAAVSANSDDCKKLFSSAEQLHVPRTFVCSGTSNTSHQHLLDDEGMRRRYVLIPVARKHRDSIENEQTFIKDTAAPLLDDIWGHAAHLESEGFEIEMSVAEKRMNELLLEDSARTDVEVEMLLNDSIEQDPEWEDGVTRKRAIELMVGVAKRGQVKWVEVGNPDRRLSDAIQGAIGKGVLEQHRPSAPPRARLLFPAGMFQSRAAKPDLRVVKDGNDELQRRWEYSASLERAKEQRARERQDKLDDLMADGAGFN